MHPVVIVQLDTVNKQNTGKTKHTSSKASKRGRWCRRRCAKNIASGGGGRPKGTRIRLLLIRLAWLV